LQVIKKHRKTLVKGVQFEKALSFAVNALQNEDWFIRAGGLYWILDCRAGPTNGDNALLRIAKYMNFKANGRKKLIDSGTPDITGKLEDW